MDAALQNPAADTLKAPLTFSLAFHMLIFSSLLISSIRSHRGEMWGGPGGGAVTIGLVGSVPGIPLPRPAAVTSSRVVDPTRGLYQSPPAVKEPESNATLIPKFERNKPPKYDTRKSRLLENTAPPPPNAVPFGQGGAPTVPYSAFTVGSGTQGGLGFTGGGAGDFGARFPWYVEAVQRRISSNWLQSTVDPSVRWAPRVVVAFQILRDGTVTNIQLLQSSGNSSVDLSAVRAIQGSNPLERLPPGYTGSYVGVEFWFEFRRQ